MSAHRVDEPRTLLEFPDDLDAFQREVLVRGRGDGLPVIPPTPERVDLVLEGLGREPDEVIAELPPARGLATARTVAANAVMAGCRPEDVPVVIAATEAIAHPDFNLYGIQDTTNPVTPLVLVNGPVRSELEMNAGTNAFGPGNRANATIGRAIRLIMLNIGGGVPGRLDRATQGQPAKYTFCVPEHEERSPWGPFHEEHGLDRGQSAVSVFGVQAFHNIIDLTASSADELVAMLAAGMAAAATNNVTHGGETLLALAPEHAEMLAREWLTKDDVRRRLFERGAARHHSHAPGVRPPHEDATPALGGPPSVADHRRPLGDQPGRRRRPRHPQCLPPDVRLDTRHHAGHPPANLLISTEGQDDDPHRAARAG